MNIKYLAVTAILAVSSTPTLAQEFTGASFSATYAGTTEDGLDITGTSLKASGGVALSPQFALGGSLGLYNLDVEGSEDDAVNVTLRAMYRLGSSGTIGAFFANDSDNGDDASSYGIEAGYETSATFIDGYYGEVDVDDSSFDHSIYGAAIEFAVANNVSLTAGFDSYRVEDGEDSLTTRTWTIGTEYDFGNGASVYANIGEIVITEDDGTDEDSASASTANIGVSFAMGEGRGTVLGNRSVYEATLPF